MNKIIVIIVCVMAMVSCVSYQSSDKSYISSLYESKYTIMDLRQNRPKSTVIDTRTQFEKDSSMFVHCSMYSVNRADNLTHSYTTLIGKKTVLVVFPEGYSRYHDMNTGHYCYITRESGYASITDCIKCKEELKRFGYSAFETLCKKRSDNALKISKKAEKERIKKEVEEKRREESMIDNYLLNNK